MKFDYLKDETITREVRYVSFMGNLQRYDFAFMEHEDEDDSNKQIVIYLQKNRFAALGKEDIEKKGELENIFHETEMEADEIRTFLRSVL